MNKSFAAMVTVVAMTVVLASGCIGYVAKTGYYAHKGAEGFVREIQPINNPPVIPNKYKSIAILPLNIEGLGKLSDTPSFKEQIDMYQDEALAYFKSGWPISVMVAKDMDEAEEKGAALALRGTVLDYNHGSQAQKAGIGEFHTLYTRYELIDVAEEEVVGVTNIEGRVRVIGEPVQGLAKGMELWLFKYSEPQFREDVKTRREETE